MRTMMFRLALIGTVASLPALAQTTTPPATSAIPPAVTQPSANTPATRADNLRPATPDQGMAAGQGAHAPGSPAIGNNPPPNTPAHVNQMTPATGNRAPNASVNSAQSTGNNPSGAGSAATTTAQAPAGTTATTRGDTTSGNAAATVDAGTRTGPLEPGANSFTEGQARSRIEAAGFTNIQGLRKDDSGIWRGTGSRGGSAVEVGLDYRGNVAPLAR